MGHRPVCRQVVILALGGQPIGDGERRTIWIHQVKQLVGGGGPFIGGGFGGPDVHASVDLHGIGADTHAASRQAAGQLNGKAGFAPGGRSEHQHDGPAVSIFGRHDRAEPNQVCDSRHGMTLRAGVAYRGRYECRRGQPFSSVARTRSSSSIKLGANGRNKLGPRRSRKCSDPEPQRGTGWVGPSRTGSAGGRR